MKKEIYLLTLEDVNEDEAKIIDINFKDGSAVKKGNIIYVFETSKVSIEVTAKFNGFIYYSVQKNDKVKVGSQICILTNKKDSKLAKKKIKNKKSKNDTFLLTKKAEKFAQQNNINLKSLNLTGLIKEQELKKYFFNNSLLNKEKVSHFKNENILIMGSGAQIYDVIELIENNSNFTIKGIVDYDKTKKIPNYDFISEDDKFVERCNELKTNNIFCCFGWIYDLNKRLEKYDYLKNLGFKFPSFIDKSAKIYKNVEIKQGVVIFPNCTVGSNVIIQDFGIINHNAILSHDTILGVNSHLCPGSAVASNCKIGKNVCIGMNASVHFNMQIDDDKIINNNESYYLKKN